MIQQLDNPQNREQLWDDVISAQNEVLQAEAAKPAQLPRQPQPEQNHPEAHRAEQEQGGPEV